MQPAAVENQVTGVPQSPANPAQVGPGQAGDAQQPQGQQSQLPPGQDFPPPVASGQATRLRREGDSHKFSKYTGIASATAAIPVYDDVPMQAIQPYLPAIKMGRPELAELIDRSKDTCVDGAPTGCWIDRQGGSWLSSLGPTMVRSSVEIHPGRSLVWMGRYSSLTEAEAKVERLRAEES